MWRKTFGRIRSWDWYKYYFLIDLRALMDMHPYSIVNRFCVVLQIFNEKEKIQAEIAEQSSLFHTIRVKPINTMKPNELVEKNTEVFTEL